MAVLLGAKVVIYIETAKYFADFLHFYIPYTLAERAARAVRALCGRCAGAVRTHEHARGIFGAAVLPSGWGRAQRVPQPKRGAGGDRREGGSALTSRPNREHAGAAQASRAHEREGRRKERADRTRARAWPRARPAKWEGWSTPSGAQKCP